METIVRGLRPLKALNRLISLGARNFSARANPRFYRVGHKRVFAQTLLKYAIAQTKPFLIDFICVFQIFYIFYQIIILGDHMAKRIIVGISGASGVALAHKILTLLNDCPDWESYVVITPAAEKTIELESDRGLKDFIGLATVAFPCDDIGAAIASGTFETEGMLVVPCSVKTLAGIHGGYSDNLLLRAADVCVKQRRKLVLAVRESPFSQIHLRNMSYLADIGCIIMPMIPSFYDKPQSIDDLILQMACKYLAEFGIDMPDKFKRWPNCSENPIHSDSGKSSQGD
ncbi:MAG: UbiX family flavin prenyltransferase [Deltaproteobacteria bacterium]|jgi:4-hydroxy-3-polyprenylbenzoate decarboxylase|nr:UbiX family flavin prenyltransferase [Deltaproteobacteria bacterium]